MTLDPAKLDAACAVMDSVSKRFDAHVAARKDAAHKTVQVGGIDVRVTKWTFGYEIEGPKEWKDKLGGRTYGTIKSIEEAARKVGLIS